MSVENETAPKTDSRALMVVDADAGAPTLTRTAAEAALAGAVVHTPAFPSAPTLVYMNGDPSKVTLVPLGTDAFMLQFLP